MKYLLCFINIFTKYTFVKPLGDKRVKPVTHGYIQIISESKRKPKKIMG